MLQIKNISKTYRTGELVQTALNDVSLNFRDNEFVAILGPSGSGKTTLLNIIGGLDQYDDGDLVINGVSTKDFKGRDWDTYRNHTIGFIFQSYNLIPHQTVLSNVELALTIGGISKKERKERARKALEEVGLLDQAHKKPNQMSGGQMQRVAIARALVNNPSILLADEPTGALDTSTSIQVMDLLKQVAKDRLVIMVTHNPELANEYANRIVKLKDGQIISDSNPYYPTGNETIQVKEPKRVKKARMSYLTALSLSFNNLLTKKGRTILTAFAGSIGIIGIALILSLSQGFQNYIDKIQEDTLSSYPLTLTSESADATGAILSMVMQRESEHNEGTDRVAEHQILTTMFSSVGTNDLKSFKRYLEDHEKEIADDVSYISYTYSVSPLIYTIDVTGNLARLNPNSFMTMMMGGSNASILTSMSSSRGMGIFSELSNDEESYKDSYEILAGRLPEKYDEMILVLSEPNGISDLLVYSLGLRDFSELKSIIADVTEGKEIENKHEPLVFTYDDFLNLDLRLILATDTFKYNSKYDIYEDMSADNEYMNNLYDRSLKLKIVGVVTAKEGSDTAGASFGVAYTKDLTRYIMDQASRTSIVSKQLTNSDINVITGKRFDEEDEEKTELDFEDMISVDEEMIKEAFQFNLDLEGVEMLSEDQTKDLIMSTSEKVAENISTGPDLNTLNNSFKGINTMILQSLVNSFETSSLVVEGEGDEQKTYLSLKDLELAKSSFNKNRYKEILSSMSSLYPEMSSLLSMLGDNEYDTLASAVVSMMDAYYGVVKSDSGYDEENLRILYQPVINTGNPQLSYVKYGDATVSSMIYANPSLFTEANGKTAAVSGEIVKDFTTYMVAAGIGTATGEIMEPLGGLMEAFSDTENLMKIDTDKFQQAFKFNMDQDELQRVMEAMLTKSDTVTASSNLITFGYQDVDFPSTISFYFKSFDAKENFMNFLDGYNESVDDDKEISYTDITGLLMSSVKKIVDSVTYVLIAFVSISLVVSSIMIAVITLISVMERTKEIGILRAMGASKGNVSSIFNAETFIIGLLSGLIGVGTTLALIPPINALIHNLTDNYNINAVLPVKAGIALVLISVVLTVFAGIIPSRKAAKQDPVVALRTE